ncbi:hypothetical protein NQ317_017939 [Molorchus minor]|uniref:Uncharacterized protein n=1 Tax=Molorchus minor TaxID=1323400 RepID=A0ABQ9JFR3_9CUCU|nr:hypothetical protein NQ317_017939 [Molorchus minor]
MKVALLLLSIIASAPARPQFGFLKNAANSIGQAVNTAAGAAAKILRLDYDNNIDNYAFDVDTSDGFQHYQRGRIVPPQTATEEDSLLVWGSYSYIGPDGRNYTVEYYADKDGFHPAGTHIPPAAGVGPLGITKGCEASLCGTGLG